MCGAFFISAKRVRTQFTRESAVHGLQEVSGSIPVISTIGSNESYKHR